MEPREEKEREKRDLCPLESFSLLSSCEDSTRGGGGKEGWRRKRRGKRERDRREAWMTNQKRERGFLALPCDRP